MKRILIVDDNEDNLYLLRVMLEGHGYEAVQARNGSEAIVKALETLPDIVISDILMPVIDGFTLCRIWKADERLKRAPFIFYTATYTDPRDEQLARDMGADAFIVKPAEPDEFMRMIESILGKEHLLASPQEPKAGEETILKNYNETLIRKLEHKMLELERVNGELEAEIGAKSKIENTLRESEEKYRTILENMQDGYYEVDLAGNLIFFNKALCDILGYSPEELLNLNYKAYMSADTAAAMNREFNTLFKQGFGVSRIDWEMVRKDGVKRFLDASIELKPGDDGKPAGFKGICRDITERKRAHEEIERSLKEKEILLKEIHHRVKNNMQVISSMLGLHTNCDDTSYHATMLDIQNRIRSMAIVHEKLYQSGDLSNIDFRDYIETLVAGLYLAYKISSDSVKFHCNVADIALSIITSIPCGLILNELVSNALKYAFPDNRPGDLFINMRYNDDKTYTLSVRDNGIGLPEAIDPENSDTMGLSLVKVLADQLRGTLQVEKSGGTEFSITFRDDNTGA